MVIPLRCDGIDASRERQKDLFLTKLINSSKFSCNGASMNKFPGQFIVYWALTALRNSLSVLGSPVLPLRISPPGQSWMLWT